MANRELYSPYATVENLNTPVPIEKGGTGVSSVDELQKLINPAKKSKVNQSGGVVGLDNTGLIPASFLTDNVTRSANVSGPLETIINSTYSYYITNYDLDTEYNLSSIYGSVSFDPNIPYKINYTTPSFPCRGGFKINGRTYYIQVEGVIVVKPTILNTFINEETNYVSSSLDDLLSGKKVYYPSMKFSGDTLNDSYTTLIGKQVTLYLDSFSVNLGNDTHIETVWQTSLDEQFNTILEEHTVTDNLLEHTFTSLPRAAKVFVRCKFKGQVYGYSQWSKVYNFLTSKYPANVSVEQEFKDIFISYSDHNYDDSLIIKDTKFINVNGFDIYRYIDLKYPTKDINLTEYINEKISTIENYYYYEYVCSNINTENNTLNFLFNVFNSEGISLGYYIFKYNYNTEIIELLSVNDKFILDNKLLYIYDAFNLNNDKFIFLCTIENKNIILLIDKYTFEILNYLYITETLLDYLPSEYLPDMSDYDNFFDFYYNENSVYILKDNLFSITLDEKNYFIFTIDNNIIKYKGILLKENNTFITKPVVLTNNTFISLGEIGNDLKLLYYTYANNKYSITKEILIEDLYPEVTDETYAPIIILNEDKTLCIIIYGVDYNKQTSKSIVYDLKNDKILLSENIDRWVWYIDNNNFLNDNFLILNNRLYRLTENREYVCINLESFNYSCDIYIPLDNHKALIYTRGWFGNRYTPLLLCSDISYLTEIK